MELQGKDKEIGMTSSMGYNRDSSSTVSTPINSVAGEMIRDQGTVHGDAIFSLPQTLDQHNHPLYHHHQLNSQQQQQQPQTQQNLQNKPRAGSSNPEAQHPDPGPVSVANTTATSTKEANRSNQRSPAQAPTTTAIITAPSIRYRECLKNHAASMGNHVVDGCGEFMPSGEDGTPAALKCAACDCHRNFHRKEIDGESQSQSQYAAHSLYTYNNHPSRNNSTQRNHHHQQQQQPPLPFHHHQQHHRISYTSPQTASIAPWMMTFGGVGGGSSGGLDESSSEDLNMFHSSAGGQTSMQAKKKRFRTKFSQEQKDKMMEFAETLGWRIQKQDDQQVHDFCTQVGVKRQVFKVWMHNNKQASKKKHE